jgi:MinD superfamily P-loop ATPase
VPAVLEHQDLSSETVQLGRKRDVRDLVVVSGKGGTGKTSIVASFFALAEEAAGADCDVDAADLHLVLDPVVRSCRPFSGGKTAVIDMERCSGCGVCADRCRFGAVELLDGGRAISYGIDPVSCEGCGVCVDICPGRVVSLVSSVSGEWFLSDTRHGPVVHARLGVARDNSGKLVSLVRSEAKALSASRQRKLLLCDGSPGIGCPVIASIAGASMVLIVAEPTLSGLHDLGRVAELCEQFNVKTGVCINKADINPEMSDRIEAAAAMRAMPVLGRIRYDESVTAAQVKHMAVVENGDGPAATDMRALWERVKSVSGGFAR